MDILGRARRLESKLTQTFDRAARQWSESGPRGPLEVLHAVLEAVEARLEPAGRGTRVFPFNRIKVSVVAASREARARFSSVLEGDQPLQERIATRLRAAGCDAAGLQVRIAYVTQPAPDWATPECQIEFDRVAAVDLPAPPSSTPHEIRLTITNGSADKPAYALTLDRINLGRCVEVRDSRNRLIRTNHVVFKDGEAGANHSVSRRHAHIRYGGSPGDYRISDDRSAHGTSIMRNGEAIAVPAGSRGIRLQSGDEVVLGEARIRVRIGISG